MADKDPVLKSTEADDRTAFDLIKQQRDQAIAERDTATGALTEMMKVHDASKALVGKVADPFTVAEMISPRLAEVKREDVVAHVTSEQFAPHLTAFRGIEPVTPVAGEAPTDATPASEPVSGGFGPSPGVDSNSKPLDGKQPIMLGSPEYQKLLLDPAAMEQAYKDGRVAEPARTY